MKRLWLFIAIVATGFIGGCKSGGTDKEIATDMCGCFNMLKKEMPPDALKVFEIAAVSATPQETFSKEIANLDPETATKVTAALMSTANEGSPINDCLKGLDKKYKTTTSDQQAVAKRMVDALKDTKGCDIMLTLMRMSAKK